MKYRKFRADKLFAGTQLQDNEVVLITDEKGKVQDIVPVSEAGDDVEQLTGWLSPGFINCHCHLELSHMKGLIPGKTGLVDFVFSIVTQRHFPEDEILQAIADAEAEMIRNGIVAVGDICNNQLTLPQKMQDNLRYYNFVEASGWLPSIAEMRFLQSEVNYLAFQAYHPTSLVPHAPYSVSPELFQLIKPCFQGKVVSIHNQETSFENDLFTSNTGDFLRMYEKMNIDHSFFSPTGKSSMQSYFHELENASNAILVHNTFTSEEDIMYLHDQIQHSTFNIQNNQPQTFFCLCINANQYIEDAVPPVELLRKHNTNIVLGTDSLASNWSLSIWDEIKTIRKFFPHIALDEILGWATINGAKALQMDEQLGSFEKGKTPGVLLVSDDQNIQRLI